MSKRIGALAGAVAQAAASAVKSDGSTISVSEFQKLSTASKNRYRPLTASVAVPRQPVSARSYQQMSRNEQLQHRPMNVDPDTGRVTSYYRCNAGIFADQQKVVGYAKKDPS